MEYKYIHICLNTVAKDVKIFLNTYFFVDKKKKKIIFFTNMSWSYFVFIFIFLLSF